MPAPRPIHVQSVSSPDELAWVVELGDERSVRVSAESPVKPSGIVCATRPAAVPVAPDDGSPLNMLSSTPIPWLRYGIVPGSPGAAVPGSTADAAPA